MESHKIHVPNHQPDSIRNESTWLSHNVPILFPYPKKTSMIGCTSSSNFSHNFACGKANHKLSPISSFWWVQPKPSPVRRFMELALHIFLAAPRSFGNNADATTRLPNSVPWFRCLLRLLLPGSLVHQLHNAGPRCPRTWCLLGSKPHEY